MTEKDNPKNHNATTLRNNKNLIPIKKGDAKIPGSGRKKGTPNRSTIAKLVLGIKKKVLINGKEETITMEEVMTRAIANKANSGDTNAYKALLDSAHGAPKQDINTTIEDKRIDLED